MIAGKILFANALAPCAAAVQLEAIHRPLPTGAHWTPPRYTSVTQARALIAGAAVSAAWGLEARP